MVTAALLGVSALAATLVGARVLDVLIARDRLTARTLLRVWAALTAGVFVAAASSVAIVAVPGHASVVGGVLQTCLNGLDSAVSRTLELVAGPGVFALVLAVSGWRAAAFWRTARRRDLEIGAHHALLARLLNPTGARSPLWLPTSTPMAYSTPGRTEGLIVASEGLRQRLDPAALSAVMAHEQAHVHGHHHLFVRVADCLSHAVPWLPLTRQASPIVRALVEFDADAHAAHEHGDAAVVRAITHVHPTAPAGALGIARDCVDLRLHRLGRSAAPGTRPSRSSSYAAPTAAAMFPILLFLAGLATVFLAACPA